MGRNAKRRKGFRASTPAKCSRSGCYERATHALIDPEGDTVRSCDLCWPGLVVAIESLGGRVGLCGCPACGGRASGPERLTAAASGARRGERTGPPIGTAPPV
jgi:hypothetical protein